MKKGIKLICSAAAMALVFSSCYITRESEVKKTITVSGAGTITSSPDIAEINFSVVTAGWSAKQIVADNDTLSKRLADAVKNLGINENDIVLSDCLISNPSNQYEARRNIRITVRNISLVPAVIDCKAGASTRLKSVTYGLNDSVATMRRARSAAVQQTQDAASLLAGASGSKISNVVDIIEEKTETGTTPDGKINVTSEVKVTYSIQ